MNGPLNENERGRACDVTEMMKDILRCIGWGCHGPELTLTDRILLYWVRYAVTKLICISQKDVQKTRISTRYDSKKLPGCMGLMQ